MRRIHAVRHGLTGTLALLAAVTALVVVPQPAGSASAADNVDTIDVADFVAAGVAVSQMAFPERAEAVVLATTANFPDALAASALAASFRGPVLFSDADELSGATAAEIDRVLGGTGPVYLMGGTAALSQAVADDLTGRGYSTHRVAGATRLETAVAAGELVGVPSDGTALVVRAFGPDGANTASDRTTGWVDAIGCGAFAAAGEVPIYLTETDRLSAPTRDALAASGVVRAVVCGGTAAVGEAVAAEVEGLGIDLVRVAGPTRVETAVAAARTLFGYETAAAHDYLIVPGYGESFGFGLAATALAAQRDAPILLAGSNEPTSCTDQTQPSRATLCYLATAGQDPARLVVVGSSALVGDAVVAAAAVAAGAAALPEEPARCDPDAAVQPSELVPQPTVTGPIGDEGIRTGEPYGATLAPLPEGWVEQEFFFSGSARSYGLSPGEREYTQKILVRRPTDPAEFNGTIVFDWNNVTLPHDRSVAWNSVYATVYERGFAFVSVSAQFLGTEAGPLGLKQYDPVRYGSLSHPGDDYSWDIFSQAAEAAITPQVLGELVPCIQRRIAMGSSQAGGRVTSYINDVHEHALVFDGFQPQITGAGGVRRDLVPTLVVNSQAEVSTVEPDSDLFRLWEVVGAAHTNYHGTSYQTAWLTQAHSNGLAGAWDAEEAGAWGYQAAPGDCLRDNYHPSFYNWSAGMVALDDWLRSGVAPEPQPRAARDEAGNLLWDEHGNLLGGVRSPIMDVPIASYYVGVTRAPGADPCGLAGGSAPLRGLTRVFDAATLAALYPSPEDYLTQIDTAVEEALAAGWILPEGAEDLRRRAVDAAAWIADATS